MLLHTLAIRTLGDSGGGSGFSVESTPIQLPRDISNATQLSGLFGGNIIHLAVNLFFFAGMLLTFAFVFYGGFKWMTSQGDKKKIEEARNTLIFSVVGFLVMSIGYLVISVIGAFFKVQLFGI